MVLNKINGQSSNPWSIRHWVLAAPADRRLLVLADLGIRRELMCKKQPSREREKDSMRQKPVSSSILFSPGFKKLLLRLVVDDADVDR